MHRFHRWNRVHIVVQLKGLRNDAATNHNLNINRISSYTQPVMKQNEKSKNSDQNQLELKTEQNATRYPVNIFLHK